MDYDGLFLLHVQDLKDYMRQAGEVTYADAHKQRRNEGYVYSTRNSCFFFNVGVVQLFKVRFM